MARAAGLPGGDLEYAVLAALWELGAGTGREIHDRVGAPAGLVYTTTAKVLDRLRAKRLIRRSRRGRSLVFQSCVPRAQVEEATARHMLDRFLGPAPERALAALVGAVEATDPKLLDALAQAVEARRRSSRGS